MKNKATFPQFTNLNKRLIDQALSGQGVYMISREGSDRHYIGQTSKRDFQQRWHMHLNALQRGNHHCKKLQDDWNLQDSRFTFEIIMSCRPDQCRIEERRYIKLLKPFYNAGNHVLAPYQTRPQLGVLLKSISYSTWTEAEITIPAGSTVFVCPVDSYLYWKGHLVHIEADEYQLAS